MFRPGGSAGAAGTGMSGAAGIGGMPGDEKTCGQVTHKLERLPPELLLVLDRSATMGDSVVGSMNSRWVEVRGALDDVVKETQERVQWGLKLFPTVSGCVINDMMEVPVMLDNHAGMSTAMNATSPNNGTSGTPMQLALRKATEHLTGRNSKNPKYLVIGTDGLPNCRDAKSGTEDSAGVTQAIADAAKMNIRTFVIGIAAHSDGQKALDALNMFADAGGEARKGMDPRFFPVNNRADLTRTLNDIAVRVSSCVFPLDMAPPVPENVRVKTDGTTVERDMTQTTGWNYGAGMKNIQVYGAICEQLKLGKIMDVQITFGCPNKPIE